MEAVEALGAHQVQVDLLIVCHFRLFALDMLVIVKDLVLTELVVELDELFQWLAIPDRIGKPFDNSRAMVSPTGLYLVQCLLYDA